MGEGFRPWLARGAEAAPALNRWPKERRLAQAARALQAEPVKRRRRAVEGAPGGLGVQQKLVVGLERVEELVPGVERALSLASPLALALPGEPSLRRARGEALPGEWALVPQGGPARPQGWVMPAPLDLRRLQAVPGPVQSPHWPPCASAIPSGLT